MSRIVDNLVAFRVLYMLVTPFTETQAFKLGIIDEKGNTLKKSSQLKTGAERDAFTYLHRLVFNVKRILAKLPGGDNRLKSVVAALWLVKESYEMRSNPTKLEENYKEYFTRINFENICFAEEELLLKEILDETNVTGAGVSTDQPVIRVNKSGKRYGSFKVSDNIYRRFKKKTKPTDITEYLDVTNTSELMLYEFVEHNPKRFLVLKSDHATKIIKFDSDLQAVSIEEF
jgi:hypothetical protein